MKHLEKEKQAKRLKNSKIIIIIIGFLVMSLATLQIIIANQTASLGGKMEELRREAEKLQEENRKLETEIAKFSSLGVIEQKAKKLGYKRASSVIFLTTPLPVALKTR